MTDDEVHQLSQRKKQACLSLQKNIDNLQANWKLKQLMRCTVEKAKMISEKIR